ncbi:hypothetical protein [Legionella sp.]|uniref:hypothetical protein n=1 Tax=Legionella sp. TaxID=459 RepID=UPI003220740B
MTLEINKNEDNTNVVKYIPIKSLCNHMSIENVIKDYLNQIQELISFLCSNNCKDENQEELKKHLQYCIPILQLTGFNVDNKETYSFLTDLLGMLNKHHLANEISVFTLRVFIQALANKALWREHVNGNAKQIFLFLKAFTTLPPEIKQMVNLIR